MTKILSDKSSAATPCCKELTISSSLSRVKMLSQSPHGLLGVISNGSVYL